MRENIDSAKNTEQLQILLSRFSHELRNPLALLSSELQLLASSHPDLSYDEQWEISWEIWNISMRFWTTCPDIRMQGIFPLS